MQETRETSQKNLVSYVLLLASKAWGMRHYTLIAGTGWLIDNATYLTLIYGFHMPVFYAANIGILLGAGYVYALATRKIFTAGAGFNWLKWAWFMAYTLLAAVFWSAVIDGLVQVGLWPVLAKIAILPFSFYSNFLFLGWLQEGHVRWH